MRLSASSLNIHYNGTTAVRDVTLDIAPGRITALVGPSGCGKTSFLCCLNRLTDLVAGCRVTGTLTLDGENILHPALDVVRLRRRVGMIFQKPNPFPLSIRQNLALPLREHGLRDRTALEEKIESALREVGLWDEVRDRLDSPATALSGGQQQRLCLARALSLNSEVVLLDEPCSALDPIASGVIEDHIRGLRGRYTVVVVTHNLAQARRLADDAAVFWLREGSGRLVANGPAAQVLESPDDPDAAAYVRGGRG